MNIWQQFLKLKWWGKSIVIIFLLWLLGTIFGETNSTQTSLPNNNQVIAPSTNNESDTNENQASVDKEEIIVNEPKLVFTISGDNGNTAPFTLNSGSYKVSFNTFKECYYGADLESVDGSTSEPLINTLEIGSGETYLYNIVENEYYVSMITGGGCKWDITFSQL